MHDDQSGSPGLISEYHMNPVLMDPVLGLACQHAAAAAMIRNLGHQSGCLERYPHGDQASHELQPDSG